MSNSQAPLAYRQHDHQLCIDEAMSQIKALCHKRGLRLTTLREQVLRLIWTSHQPLGAYTLMDMLAEMQIRRIAPPTVYRALSFLQEHHFIHKIHCLNAYIGCAEPSRHHQGHFLICQSCGVAVECRGDVLNQALVKTARTAGFRVQHQHVEILGCCPRCSATDEKENPLTDKKRNHQ